MRFDPTQSQPAAAPCQILIFFSSLLCSLLCFLCSPSQSNPEVVCYSSEHTTVAVLAFAGLCLVSVGFPIVSFLTLFGRVRTVPEAKHESFGSSRKQTETIQQTERRMGFLYRGLRPGFQYYRFSLFFLLLSSAVNSTVLKELSVKLVSHLTAFFLQFVYILVYKPFKKERENIITLLTGLGKGGFVLVLLVLQDEFHPFAFAAAVVVLLSGFALSVVVVVRKRKANAGFQAPTNIRIASEAARPAAEMARLPKSNKTKKISGKTPSSVAV